MFAVQRTQIVLVDDVDGGEASETVVFALDGVSYEIDLSADNAAQLRDSVNPPAHRIPQLRDSVSRWVGAGRKVGKQASGAGRRSRGTSSGMSPSRGGAGTEVREWARQNGYTVSDRGRIPAGVAAAYAARG